MPLPYRPQGYRSPSRTVKAFTRQVTHSLTNTVGFLLGASAMPDKDVERVGRGLHGALTWVDQRDKFAGQPGALSGMRLKALDIDDPLVREQALDFIRALKALPPDQQQAFAALQRAGSTQLSTYQRRGMPEASNVLSTAQRAVTAIGGQSRVEGGQLVLAPETASQGILAAIRTMFPGLQASIGTSMDQWEELDNFLMTPVEPNAVGQYIYDKSRGVRRATEIIGQINEGKKGFTLGTVLAAAGSGLQAPFDVSTAAIGTAGRTVGAEGITQDAGDLAKSAEEEISKAIMPALSVGLDPENNAHDRWVLEQRAAAFGLATYFAGGVLAPAVGRRLKLARSVPGVESAEAALAATRSIPRGGPLGIAAEVYKLPIRTMTRLLDDQLVRFARDPEKWWRSGIRTKNGKKIIQVFDEAKKAHPGTSKEAVNGQVGFVREHFGTGPFALSDTFVRGMLKETTPGGMERYFVDTLTGPVSREALTQARTRLGTVRQQLFDVDSPEALEAKRAQRAALVRELGGNRTYTNEELTALIQENTIILQHPTSFMDERYATRLTGELREAKQVGTAVDLGDNIWRYESPNDVTGVLNYHYVKVDELNQSVYAYRNFDPATGDVLTQRLEGAPYRGSGHDLLKSHWRDIGVRSVADGLEQAKRQTFSEAGAKLNLDVLTEMAERFRDLQNDLLSFEFYKNAASRLRLEQDFLEWQLKTSKIDTPMLRYPRRSVLRGAFRGTPTTKIQRMIALSTLQGKNITDVTKFVDELPRFPDLYIPGGEKTPINWLDHNTDVLSNYLQRAGVDEKTVQRRIGEMGTIKTEAEFYDLVEKQMFGEGGDIDQALPSSLDPRLRSRIINLHDTPIEGRTRAIVTETADTLNGPQRITRPALGREVRPGERTPIPSRPSEQLNTLRLPDVELLLDANTLLRRASQKIESKGIPGKIVDDIVFDVPKYVLGLSTMVLKPLVMLVRLPAMAMRIQMEQALRITSLGYRPFAGIPKGITLFPGGIPVPFTATKNAGKIRALQNLFGDDGWQMLSPDPRLRGFADPEAHETGMFMSEFMYQEPVTANLESTLDFRRGARSPTRHDYDAWLKALDQSHNDWLSRGIVERNFDEKAILEWLDTDDWAKRYMARQQDPQIAQAGVTREAWLRDQMLYLHQLTRDNPVFLDAIRSGRIREHRTIAPETMGDGRNAATEYNRLVTEIDEMSGELRTRNKRGAPDGEDPDIYDTDLNRLEMNVMMNERLRKMRRAEAIRREFPEIGDSQKAIKLSDKYRARNALEDHWKKNEWEMPEHLLVEQRVRPWHRDGGVLDDLERYAGALNNALYKPFRALTWVDRKGTRGSLFTQAYLRRKFELEARGYDPFEANAYARAYAAETTKDIMYDLTARTSAQRAMKDIFWFAPAWQEVMYTWLVKIPSESYWPVGAAGLVLKYQGLKEALREVGILQEDSNGEDIITVPGLDVVVEKVTGTKVPPIVFGKLSGLNLVTTGGGVPGLSTPANFALGAAALRFGGPFKALSDMFQPYGPEASILPMPITYLHEAVFGEPPPWEFMSPDLTKTHWDQTFDTGLQYAFADMKARGVTPPLPENYGTQNEDGTWTLTSAQETAYKKASDRYQTELFSLGDRYARGMAWIKLTGGTVSPMALYTTSEGREGWRKFWNTVIAPRGFGSDGLSEAQESLIDSYLEDHPNSTAYSVFYTQYGEKVHDLPFKENPDDAIFDDYYTGEKEVLSPRDFSHKLMAMESLRHYQSRTDAVLDKISPSRDPWKLLTNGFDRSDAILKEKESWDRYLYLNPEADAILKRSRAAMVEAKNIPVRSFEAERLGNTLNALKQISPQLSGEAPFRSDEVREVISELQSLYSADNTAFGKPNTPSEKAMSWWFDNVLDPYFTRTQALYTEAQDLEAHGLSAAPVYNEIRKFSNALPPSYKGAKVPTVEEVFFGNKSTDEQEAAVLKWTSRPVSWLTNFQLDKVGYASTPAAKKYLNSVSEFDEQFYQHIAQNSISLASDEYDRLQDYRTKLLASEAEKAGVSELFVLNEAQPYVRLNDKGFGEGNTIWQESTQAAGEIIQRIEAEDLSPKGFSETAISLKGALYAAIERARDEDAEYDKLWTKLSYVMPLPGGGYRQGATLYEAILFGNFNTDYIPYDIAKIAGG